MKKLLYIILLFSMVTYATVARSQNNVEATDPGFVMADVLVYRPLGVIATLVGGALFVGASPLTALATIPAPHDAFDKTFKILVLAPAAYTFVRPLGDRRFVGYLPGRSYSRAAQPVVNKTAPVIRQPLPKQQPAVTPLPDDPLWMPHREKTH